MKTIIIRIIFFPYFFLRWLWRMKWKFFIAFLLLGTIGGGIVGGLYYYYICKHPGREFSREAIMNSLSIETPVYYDDGESLIGVFFENEHRIYIPYQDIPKNFVNALVAAEDKYFFIHPGINPFSIVRAFAVNLRAKMIVQGGSTLSQQTAKNIFKRKGRTVREKLRELIQTLKLEAHFSKEEIVEFFTNQFYVSGTGRGLGIAAKYFFDKSADELDLLECAFIAGSVRAPNKYNPLIQSSPQKQNEVMQRAVRRKNYVLRNMAELGMISPPEYKELMHAPIPFKKGRIYYRQNVIMDFVREQLQSEQFRETLTEHGISNVATSGIRVYTTINKDIQEAGLRIMRKHLSRLETLITGYDREVVQSRYAQVELGEKREPTIGAFRFGTAEEKARENKNPVLLVRVGKTLCKVDYDGLMNLASPYKKSKSGIWAEATAGDVEELLSHIEKGDSVYVFVREKSPEGNVFVLDLEQKARLEGGFVVLKQGRIVSLAGGSDNINFNRAVEGKRQLGSIFKPLVYTAAVQLGWNIVDPLPNGRDVFVFQDQFYFPRPDHESRQKTVSLAWAGVKSENLASVWLLYHLCDKLSFAQFKKVAAVVDLAPRENERYADFKRRVRDRWGIIAAENTLREVAFESAREEVATDLIFEGRTREAEALRFLKYGSGFEEYQELLLQEKEILSPNELTPSVLREYAVKDRILRAHFLRYNRLNSMMLEEWAYLKDAFLYSFPDPEVFYGILSRFYTGFVNGQPVIAYGDDLSDKGFSPLTYSHAYDLFAGEVQPFVPSTASPEAILIEGEIRSSVLSHLKQTIERELPKVTSQSPYDMMSLWRIKDYRTLVGLLYVVKLCEKMGIETALEPVLSFPLGPNAVSILEMAQAYSTLLEGKRDVSENGVYPDSLIIDRIVDPQGEEIYRFIPHETQLLDTRVVTMVAEILKNVVLQGTGNRAREAVTMNLDLGVKSKRVDVTIFTLGKTGTANEYSNSSYIGFIPTFAEESVRATLHNAFVLATYVGYDDNTPMENDRIRIFGASGALPVWIDVAREVVKNPGFQASIDPVDFAFLGERVVSLSQPADTIVVPIDPENGLPLSLDKYLESRTPPATLFTYGQWEGGFLRPQRFFAPLPETSFSPPVSKEEK
ncbi:MAG: transglycosylase domain-containing protein [Deltaproteobacteria bacterium]|nr:transglycosylase domain-containing protein [Deltaproteobacteria bacterium]